jgi:hypothetical protein
MHWDDLRMQPQERLSIAAARKLKQDEMLLTQLAGTRLQYEINRIPLWRGDDVHIKQLADDFAKYLYLPRLKDTDVLLAAITNGVESLVWEHETFAYADGWDAVRNRYRGLRAGQHVQVTLNAECLLVKPEVAARQLAAKQEPAVQPVVPATETGYSVGQAHPKSAVSEQRLNSTLDQPASVSSQQLFSTTIPVPTAEPRLHRFHGSVKLNERLIGRDAGRIADEVIKHLVGLLGAKVEVTLEISAELPDGAPESVVHTVTENCRFLHFDSSEFEEN